MARASLMVKVETKMRSNILRTLAGALLAMLVTAAPAMAQAQRLPEFTVRGAEGPVPASAITGQGRTLVIYVQPDCPPCDTLVQLLGEWQSALLVERTVLLVAGDVAAAERVAGSLPDAVANVRVYADPEGTAAKALGLTGAPVLIGVEDGRADWTIAGVLANVGMLESIVRSWVEVPR